MGKVTLAMLCVVVRGKWWWQACLTAHAGMCAIHKDQRPGLRIGVAGMLCAKLT